MNKYSLVKLMENDGADNTKKLLSKPYKIDGIFSANDVAAIGSIKYLKSVNVKIPEDIAIVGFSNEPISSVIEPSLTTINQSGFEIGKTAANLLIKQIKNKMLEFNNETIILNSNLIKRKSSIRDN